MNQLIESTRLLSTDLHNLYLTLKDAPIYQEEHEIQLKALIELCEQPVTTLEYFLNISTALAKMDEFFKVNPDVAAIKETLSACENTLTILKYISTTTLQVLKNPHLCTHFFNQTDKEKAMLKNDPIEPENEEPVIEPPPVEPEQPEPQQALIAAAQLEKKNTITRILPDLCNELINERMRLLKKYDVEDEDKDSLPPNAKRRYEIIQDLDDELTEISTKFLLEEMTENKINAWRALYKLEMTTAINNSLNNPSLDKYHFWEKLGLVLLNILSVLSVASLPIKRGFTGTWFFSLEGKSKEALRSTKKTADDMDDTPPPPAPSP